MSKPVIGFIGLGVMGLPMARHLATAGYAMRVLDLNRAVAAGMAADFPAVVALDRPADIGLDADIVVTMLPSGKPVHDTAIGTGGLIETMRPGALLLDTSSSEPWHTQATGRQLAEAGIGMVDAPVSGAEAGAKAAELIFMVGGADEDVARVTPLLDLLGRQSFHLGPVGAGHTMKSINNLITAVTFMATGEGLLAGSQAGLDPQVMVDVLNQSTGMSWISQTHFTQRIFNRRFDDPFKLDLMMKDVDIALDVAKGVSLDMPLSLETARLWREIQSELPPGASVSKLIAVMEQRADTELRGSI